MKKTIMTLVAAFALGCGVAAAQAQSSCPVSKNAKAECETPCNTNCTAPEQAPCNKPCNKPCVAPCDQPCTQVCDQVCDRPCYKKDFCKGKKDKRRRPGCFNGNPGDCMKELNLTPAQQAEMSKLFKERGEKMESYRNDMDKKRQKVQEKFDKDVQKILTPEQYAKFKEKAPRRVKGLRGDKYTVREGRGMKRAECEKVDCRYKKDGLIGKPQPGPKPALQK